MIEALVPPSPPTKQQFSIYNPIKTAFLAVVIAPAPFLFQFHTNFDID